jgi:hypothetical protein
VSVAKSYGFNCVQGTTYGVCQHMFATSTSKVRAPIPSVYTGFYKVYYKDIREFQILYLQDICW